jgi:ketosteroid isomerase-like protein
MLALLVIVAVGFWVPRGTESTVEDELRQLARELSAAPGDTPTSRRARVEAAVHRYVSPDARLRIAEAPAVTGPDADLVAVLVGLIRPDEEADVELTRIEARVGSDIATAQVDARVSGDTGRDLHAPHRQLTLRLKRTGSGWRIVDADVPAATLPEPEPRP